MQTRHCSPTKRIWQVYYRNIHVICLQWLCISLSSTLAGPPGLPALCRGTHALLADLLCFSNRESCNTKLGQSKNPQPSVDLIHMVALGTTYSTYEILAWLRLLTYELLTDQLSMLSPKLLMIYLWFTYSIYDLLMQIMFTYITHDLLMIYLWFT